MDNKHTEWSQESDTSQSSCTHYFQPEPDTGSLVCKNCGKNIISKSTFRNEVQFDPSNQNLLGRNLKVGQNDIDLTFNKNYKDIDLMGQRFKLPRQVVDKSKILFSSFRENHKIRPTPLKPVTVYIACRQDEENNNKMMFDFSEDTNLAKRGLSRTFHKVMKNDIEKHYKDNPRQCDYPLRDTMVMKNDIEKHYKENSRECYYPPRKKKVMLNRFFNECFPEEKNSPERDQILADALKFYNRMKKNHLHVGRIPSGIYGTSILLGCTLNKRELSIRTVAEKTRLGESTIRKRLSELDATPGVEQSVEDYITTPVEMWQTNELHPCMKGNITDYFIHEEPPPFDKTSYLTSLSSLLNDLYPNIFPYGDDDIYLSQEDEVDVDTYILDPNEVEFKTDLWEQEFGSGVIKKEIRRPRIPFKANEYRNITQFLSPTSSRGRDEQTTAIETSRRKRRAAKKRHPYIPDPSNSQITEYFSQTSVSPNNSQSSELPAISSQPDPILPPLFEEINKDLPPIHPYLTPDRSYAHAYSPVPIEVYPAPPTPPDSECEDSFDIQLHDDYNVFSPSSSGSNAGNRP